MTTPGTGAVMTPEEVLKMARDQKSRAADDSKAPPVDIPLTSAPTYKAVDPYTDPTGAQALANQAMGKVPDAIILPPRPPVDEIELSGGWIDRAGNLHKKVRIREMNGTDEEELAKPYQRTSVGFSDTIVKRCTVSIDGNTPEPRHLDQLLIGDRDAIVIGVRILTFGPTIEVPVTCRWCAHQFDILLDLEKDITTKELPGDPKQRTRELILPRGEIAKVNLMDGAAQMAAYGGGDMNDAERTSVMLKECVYSINDDMVTSIEQIKRLGSGTRRALITFIEENSCGPQWMGVKQECPNCQKSEDLPLSLVALFL